MCNSYFNRNPCVLESCSLCILDKLFLQLPPLRSLSVAISLFLPGPIRYSFGALSLSLPLSLSVFSLFLSLVRVSHFPCHASSRWGMNRMQRFAANEECGDGGWFAC